ncbi:glycosyl transferase [Ferrigenium kumadai]|uniref:Glycosyl transferase n=2 Tax=Ferrigenium kumadai TaxID=1682490 RepID=A0AAN1T0T7_9PROT|nr:glycosyl transferase [Ferrigenium kumadai]
MRKTLISVVIPVYNEEDNIEASYEAVLREFNAYDDIDVEIIFTDNHSVDKSFSILSDIAKRDRRVKVLRFTRNFGFNKSILAGYRHASGDAAIQIDCDLEDPPSLFHEFIRLWRDGHDVVVGIRAQRKESRAKALVRRSFYALLNNLSDVKHEVNSGDFRLIDRTVLDQLKIIQDPHPFVRGLVSELSINPASVSFSRNSRQFGESKFPLRQLIRLALEGVYAHSTAPLKLATYAGLIIALLMALLTGCYIIARLLAPGEWPAGFATTTILILFGISLNALFLGIIGEYIARIYQQVRMRPYVVIEKALNIEASGGVYNEKI